MNPLLLEILQLSALVRDPATTDASKAAYAQVIAALSAAVAAPTPIPSGGVAAGTAGLSGLFHGTSAPTVPQVAYAPALPTAPPRILPMSDADAYVNGDRERATEKAARWAAQQLARKAAAELGPNGYVDVRVTHYPGTPALADVRMLWNPSGNAIMNAAYVYRDFAYGDGAVSLSDLHTALQSPPNTANLNILAEAAVEPEFRAIAG